MYAQLQFLELQHRRGAVRILDEVTRPVILVNYADWDARLGHYLRGQPTSIDPDNVYHSWLKIIVEYTSMEITKEEDKLPAIAGIARATSNIIKDEYLAGIWRKDLLRQFCWFQNRSKTRFGERKFLYRPAAYRAPSWSWAALNGPVCYPIFDYSPEDYGNPVAPKVLAVSVELKGPDIFGSVTSGALKLRGCLGQVQAEVTGKKVDSAVWKCETTQRLRILDGKQHGGDIGLIITDLFSFWSFNNPQRSFYVLRLWQFDIHSVQVLEDDDQSWECQLLGLGLEMVDEDRQEFTRLGLVRLRPEAERWFTDCGEDVVINII